MSKKKKKKNTSVIPVETDNAAAQESPGTEPEGGEEFTVLTPEGEDRRPVTDRGYVKRRGENMVDFSALAQAEDELHRLKEEAGIEEEQGFFVRLINRYYEWKENRTLHQVSKKLYIVLNVLLGWCGGHRFYERRWILGLFYLALCWTGFPAMLCVTDLFIVIPKKADENGKIWL